jgi:rubrerythrin
MEKEDLVRFKNFRNNDSPISDIELELDMVSNIKNTEKGPKGPLVTPRTLPREIESLLNTRLGDEYTAYYFYRNAANWCKNANYKKAAAFFEAELAGELEHSEGIQNYLTQWNLIPRIPEAPTFFQFESLVDIINKAYELEYGSNVIELSAEFPINGPVMIIDDVLATGGTAVAICNLLHKHFNIPYEQMTVAVLLNLTFLPGHSELSKLGVTVKSIINE